ncbi:MAG: hypothetical protein AAGH79_06660 [Bacteroidota bacterium]
MLREGVVYDAERKIMYLTQPSERVAAIDIQSGRVLWETSNPGQPINLWEGQLICLIKENGPKNQLIIQQLDPENKGALRREWSTLLPPEVIVLLQDEMEATFKIRGSAVAGQFMLVYRYTFQNIHAYYDPENINKDRWISGAFTMNKEAPDLTPADLSDIPNVLTARVILPRGNEVIAGRQNDPQYLSGNGNHVLVSTRIREDIDFFAYRWDIYEVNSESLLGQLETYRSYAPFMVDGTLLFWEDGSYWRRLPNGDGETVGLSIRGINLSTGAEISRIPMLEFSYQGTFPH